MNWSRSRAIRRMAAVPATKPQTDAWTREADAIALPRLDEVGGHPRPAIGTTYAELEYEALAEEQSAAWSAEGDSVARPFQVRARGQDAAATAAAFLVTEHEQEVRAAQADHQHAQHVLQPYVRREPFAKLRYWIGWIILALGDASGVLSAAIVLGEVPLVAAGQALSAGLAATCSGLIGSELKYRQLARARQRDVESLSADERRYQALFTGVPAGAGVLRLVGGLSVVIVLVMAVAIYTLRTSVEGSAAGITFGLLAAVTALGSLLLSYASADDVADLLATTAKRLRRAEQHHRALAAAAVLQRRAEADEAARSILAEYQHRGQAATKRVESLRWRVVRRNPQVAGHGFPTGEQTGVVGRRARTNGSRR